MQLASPKNPIPWGRKNKNPTVSCPLLHTLLLSAAAERRTQPNSSKIGAHSFGWQQGVPGAVGMCSQILLQVTAFHLHCIFTHTQYSQTRHTELLNEYRGSCLLILNSALSSISQYLQLHQLLIQSALRLQISVSACE